MEFADGGDLQNLIDKKVSYIVANNNRSRTFFSEKDILNYFIQCSLALKHLHAKHILHRDLKPQVRFKIIQRMFLYLILVL